MAQSRNACAGTGPARGTNSTRGALKIACCTAAFGAAYASGTVPVFRAAVPWSLSLRCSGRKARHPGTGRSPLAAQRPRHAKAFGIGIGQRDAGAERLDHGGAQVPAVVTTGHPCASASSVTPLTRSRNSARSYGCRQMLPGKFAAYSAGDGVSPDESERRIAHGFESRDVRARRGVVFAVMIRA